MKKPYPKPDLADGETFVTTAEQLIGSAMPNIMLTFRAAIIGRTIVDAGYIIQRDDPTRSPYATPALLLDDGQLVTASRDDEFNGPGVLMHKSNMLCETGVLLVPPKQKRKK